MYLELDMYRSERTIAPVKVKKERSVSPMSVISITSTSAKSSTPSEPTVPRKRARRQPVVGSAEVADDGTCGAYTYMIVTFLASRLTLSRMDWMARWRLGAYLHGFRVGAVPWTHA